MWELSSIQNALVFGGGHGIGRSLAEALLVRAPNASITVQYRDQSKLDPLISEHVEQIQLDPLQEDQYAALPNRPWDLIINCIGMLESGKHAPEKSLRQIDLETLQHVFSVNAFVTPLIAKHCGSAIPKERPSAFATLSAMVGSISDNQLGGWYSYRASKAALNMFVKTISIEWARKKLPCSVLAIHPGTTKTALSEKFLKGVAHTVWEPKQSAEHILEVISRSVNEGRSGDFLNWDGRQLPW